MLVVDQLRREEMTQLGHNPHATLPILSRSNRSRNVKKITPVIVTNATVQNPSRQRALQDARNAISCAATWLAVSEGILNGNFVHSWDECGVQLNAFHEKQTVYCTAAARVKLSDKNLAPSSTAVQQQRRMLKIGLSKWCCFRLLFYHYKLINRRSELVTDTNAHGLLECAIAMIYDDNFTSCRSFKVIVQTFYLRSKST